MKDVRGELGEESSVNHPFLSVARVHGEHGGDSLFSFFSVPSSDQRERVVDFFNHEYKETP